MAAWTTAGALIAGSGWLAAYSPPVPDPPAAAHEDAQPATAPGGGGAADADAEAEAADITAETHQGIAAWFAEVGELRADETFGDMITRTGSTRLGTRYHAPPEQPGPERLRIRIDAFECVSFVESTLAVARCVAARTPSVACFAKEVQASRYRNGEVAGYASRLHYFADWLADNTRRQRLQDLTSALGGVLIARKFSYLTHHPQRFPQLLDRAVRDTIASQEATLSGETRPLLLRPTIRQAIDQLRNGDLLAIATSNKPGLLISHAGFVARDHNGVARLLHASSYHGRVLLTQSDLADYVLRRPERIGVTITRPRLPDEAGDANANADADAQRRPPGDAHATPTQPPR